MKMRGFLILLCWATIAVTTSGQSGTAQEALEAARKTAVLDGDCAAAIKQAQGIVSRFEKTDRTATARALLLMAECHEKSGNTPDAQATYARVIKEFGDQPSAVAEARGRLRTLGGAGASAQRDGESFPRIDLAFTGDAGQVLLSPDGQWFATGRGNRSELVIRSRISALERRVPVKGGTIMSVAWAPDSRALAFFLLDRDAQTTTLFIARTASATAREVMSWKGDGGEDTLLWSPTSDRLAFTTASVRDGDGACPPAQSVVKCRWDVQVASVATGATRRIGSTWVSAFRRSNYFAWSPDGKRLAFEQRGTHEAEGLRVIDANTGDGPAISAGPGTIELRAWTSGGELLLTQGGEYAWRSVAGGGTRKLRWTKGDAFVGVTLSGDRVLVQQASSKKLMLKSATDDTERMVTTGAGQETNARLSPDGRLVLFASNRDGKWALYVAALDRAPVDQPVRLAALRDAPTDSATNLSTGWGEDGTVILPLATAVSHLYRMGLDPSAATNQPMQLTVNSQNNFGPAISPDGRRIAFIASTNNRSWLSVMDADGRNERPLLERDNQVRPVRPVVWRSARELLVKDGEFTLLDADTGAVNPLALAPVFETPRGGDNWAYVPERDEIIYVVMTSGMPTLGGGTARFMAHSLSTGVARELATRDGIIPAGKMLAVAPGGERLAFVSKGALTLMTIDTAADASTDRAIGASGPPVRVSLSWAPDAQQLVTCLPSGRCEVVTISTGATRGLLPLQAAADRRHLDAAWFPDGLSVVIYGSSVQVDWHGFGGVTAQAVVKK